MEGRTTFMIAHRLSTLHQADQILVINNGLLVEQGTQEELLRVGGLYKQLHDAQIGGARSKVKPASALPSA
jgi:ABC-type multidrug transport system fused ATPase/permease subunit